MVVPQTGQGKKKQSVQEFEAESRIRSWMHVMDYVADGRPGQARCMLCDSVPLCDLAVWMQRMVAAVGRRLRQPRVAAAATCPASLTVMV